MSTLLLKGTVRLNTTAQRQQKAHRQQKMQQQKWRQRSSARSNDSRVSATTPKGVPRWISGPSNPHQDFHHRHQQPTTSRAMSWCPLPSSSSHHNSQSLKNKTKQKKNSWLLIPSTPDCFQVMSSRTPLQAVTSTLLLKGQYNQITQPKGNKEQQQKQRQRSSAISNNSRVSATSRHHYTPEGAPRRIPGPSDFYQDYQHQLQQPTTSGAPLVAKQLKLFDTPLEALSWIQSNNHGIPFLVHSWKNSHHFPPPHHYPLPARLP